MTMHDPQDETTCADCGRETYEDLCPECQAERERAWVDHCLDWIRDGEQVENRPPSGLYAVRRRG